MPVCWAKLASVAKRSAPAVRPIRIAAVSAPQPVSASSAGRCAADQDRELVLERVDLAGQAADLGDLFACDLDASTDRDPSQLPVDAVELARVGERAAFERRLELGREGDEMPAQPVLHAGALNDEIVAVIGQQPDLHRLLVQERGGEALDAVLDDSSGDRERVDLIRLARLALAAP